MSLVFQLAALPEDSCLSMFPRPHPVGKIEETIDRGTGSREEAVIPQQPNVPEVQPIEKVIMLHPHNCLKKGRE